VALQFIYDGVDMGTSVVRLGQVPGFITEAELGSVGIAGIPFDDPAGTLTVTGWKTFVVNEGSGPTGQQRLWTGYIADRKYQRATGTSLITGASRLIDTSIVELNTMLSFRLFPPTDTAANRPAETDVARLQWLLTTTYLAPAVHDYGFVNTSGGVALDAADYRGQSAYSLLSDCAQASGKNFFIYWDESHSAVGIYYDLDTNSNYTCTLKLSDVLADIDNSTCFAYNKDAYLERDPSRVYSGVQVPYSGPSSPVYVTDSGTAAAFQARDTTAPNVNTKTSAKATAAGNRYLGSINTEADRITLTVHIPKEKVTLIRAGMRIQLKSSFMPDLSSFTYCRIMRVEAKQDEETDQFYNLTMELIPPDPATPSANFLLAYYAGSGDIPPSDGSTHPWTLVWSNNNIGATSVIVGGAGPPTHQCNALYVRAIVPGESATVATFQLQGTASSGGMWVYEIGGCNLGGVTSTHSAQYLADGGTISVSQAVSASSALFGGFGFAKVDYDNGWGPTSRTDAWAAGGTQGALLTGPTGTALLGAGAGSQNLQNGSDVPWTWLGYATGTGTLSIGITANSHGDGSSAYVGGYNVGKGALIIPIVSSFSIVQSAQGSIGLINGVYNVTLGAAPNP